MDCIIPLKPIPNNTTTYKVPVDDQNISLTFRTTYNEQAKYWLLDISNSEGDSSQDSPWSLHMISWSNSNT